MDEKKVIAVLTNVLKTYARSHEKEKKASCIISANLTLRYYSGMDEWVTQARALGEKLESDPLRSSLILTTEQKKELVSQRANKEGEIVLKDGKKFYPIDRGAYGQMVIVLLLKGIIPIADIVSVDSRTRWGQRKKLFFSLSVPLEKTKQIATLDEIDSGAAMLCLIFNDCDHHTGTRLVPEGNNIVYDKDKNTGYLFDFHFAAYEFWHTYSDETLRGHTYLARTIPGLPAEKKVQITQMLEQLKTTVEGEQGIIFLSEISKRAGLGLGKTFNRQKKGAGDLFFRGERREVIKFRDEVLKRIGIALQYIKNGAVTDTTTRIGDVLDRETHH